MTDVPRSIEQLKKDAKRLKRNLGISHTEALEHTASEHGFASWETLVGQASTRGGELTFRLPRSRGKAGFIELTLTHDNPIGVIYGSSGSGKSVLSAMLARMALPQAKHVYFRTTPELTRTDQISSAAARDAMAARMLRKLQATP